MMIVHTARKLTLALAATGTLFAGMSAMATPALANHVSIGIGVGFPVYPAWGYYRPWYRPYPYYAPPVVYAAPPVVYAPPPRVIYYAPPPVYAAPIQAAPTSDVYRASNGQYCREYQTTVRIAGHYERSYGTACQEPDGSWHVAN